MFRYESFEHPDAERVYVIGEVRPNMPEGKEYIRVLIVEYDCKNSVPDRAPNKRVGSLLQYSQSVIADSDYDIDEVRLQPTRESLIMALEGPA